MVRYLEDDFQRVVRTIFEARPILISAPAPVPAPVVATAPNYKGPHERPLNVQFPDIYWDKMHLKCYNFFQQCKDHFATTGPTGSNQVPFAAIFLKNMPLFRCQQHHCKIEAQIDVSISWKRFKSFFCQSVSKSKAFINTI